MRGAPQDGLARCIFRISARTSTGIGGRPRRGCADRRRQCHAKSRRCQRTTVAGCTIWTASRQRLQTRESSTQRSRSARLSRRRRGAACWRTASWWRRARISASRSARVRRLNRIAARNAVMLGLMIGGRYQERPVSSIAASCTDFLVGTGASPRISVQPRPEKGPRFKRARQLNHFP